MGAISIVNFLWICIQLAIGFFLVFPLILFGIYQVRRRAKTQVKQPPETYEADYAVIVTAFRQVDQLPDVVQSLLALSYSNYHIYVVADDCDVSAIQINHPNVSILRPPVVLAGNVKSHFYAIQHFIREHERLIIIDSDNLVDPAILHHLNRSFDQGFEAVQGVRLPKNLNTTLAQLDAARDIYYHFFDGKVLFGAGSSATLSGSGMAFTVELYRKYLENRIVEGAGFDKVLQAAIVGADQRIAFEPEAVVYDEKTTVPDQLVGQRARWINTWFRYARFGFGLIGKGILRRSWNQFLFGVVLLRPPLFIFLLVGMVCTFTNLFLNLPSFSIWLVGYVLFIVGFILALVQSDTPPVVYKALKGIPGFIYYQIKALTKARNANRHSIATQHGDAVYRETEENQ